MIHTADILDRTLTLGLGHGLFFNGPNANRDRGLFYDMDSLFLFTFWVSTISFLFVVVPMCIFAFKYRRKPGVAQQRSPSHHTVLELTWSVIPTLILVVIFFWGFWGYVNALITPGNQIDMVMTAKKWSWDLEYPNGQPTYLFETVGANTSTPVFVLPEQRAVRFRLKSDDVLHSFWLPDFRRKFDAFPNRYTSIWFETGKLPDATDARVKKHAEGYYYMDHHVYCAEYCGDSHSEMAAIVRVVSQPQYEKFLRDIVEPPGMDPVKLGEIMFKRACATCHTVDGTRSTGPSWKDLFGKQETLADGTMVLVDENYIRESILNPGVKLVAGYSNQMTSFQGSITEKQISNLIAYMKSISANAPKEEAPTDQPAEESK